jgi:DNA-directed RNA polymerase subunit alpha
MQDDVIARNWRELIRPRRLEVEESSLTSTYGRVYLEARERGFGTTLGY